MKLRTFRIISQAVFFILFIVSYIFLNTDRMSNLLPAQWFLQLNPLTGIITSIASRSFYLPLIISGAIVLLFTMIFGRFFCGLICPLGSLIDFFDMIIGKLRKIKNNGIFYIKYQWIKYALLIFFITLAATGILFPIFFDPLALVTRVVSLIIYPLSNFVSSLLKHSSIVTLSLKTALLTAVLFLFIIGAGVINKRFWCQYVCPTGALLGVFSRFSLFRRHILPGKCNHCGRCARQCPTGAIPVKCSEATNTSECIVCGKCTSNKNSCSHFKFKTFESALTITTDVNRRHVLTGIISGFAAYPIFSYVLPKNNPESRKRVIRPPGAIDEQKFDSRCIACGECVKACPTGVIKLAFFQFEFSDLCKPYLDFNAALCDPGCTACSRVCPTGALMKLEKEQKAYCKIGTAQINKTRCLSYTGENDCLVCFRTCPWNAIEKKVDNETGKDVPVVHSIACTGCGACQKNCPVLQQKAIEVFSDGEMRFPYTKNAEPQVRANIESIRIKNSEQKTTPANPAKNDDSLDELLGEMESE